MGKPKDAIWDKLEAYILQVQLNLKNTPFNQDARGGSNFEFDSVEFPTESPT